MSYFYYQTKKIYYTESGKGKPVLFLHGNTASSRMFELLLPLYEDRFHVILIDFLGHGKSDRIEEFPAELWMEEARQTIALLEHLKLEKVNLVGTSGRTLADDFSKNLIQERTGAKTDNMAVEFYQWCQGEDWERIVDLDTKALLQCAGEKLPLFSKPLHSLQVPLLLMGSQGDEMSRADFQDEYRAIAGETGAEICIFAEGRHPAILSNAEEAAERISKFLE